VVADCGHPERLSDHRLCSHLLGRGVDAVVVRFTGAGMQHDFTCPDCRSVRRDDLVDACPGCVTRVFSDSPALEPFGAPRSVERPGGLRVEEETVTLDERPHSPVVAVAAATRGGRHWIALCGDGSVGRLDLHRRELRLHARVPEGVLALGNLGLEVSADGRFAAVVNAFGQHGSLLDLESGTEILRLDRGDYHPETSSFPIAFFEWNERTCLVHGTSWNRLDVSDARTGEALRPRTIGAYETDPAHYLDYSHSGLRSHRLPNGSRRTAGCGTPSATRWCGV